MGISSCDRLNKNHLLQWLESDVILDSNLELFDSEKIIDIIDI